MRAPGERPYRFGFILTTAAGNMTRYVNLRKYAERDAEVECVWAPVKHYLEPDPYARWPGPLRGRAISFHEARPVLRLGSRVDMVMLHVFEAYVYYCLRGLVRRWPLVSWSFDHPPIDDPRRHALFPVYEDKLRAPWRMALRYRFDLWCARRTALFFPFSRWSRDIMVNFSGIPAERVHDLHVGLDLELWPAQPLPAEDRRPAILFVGGDFVRKGGDRLAELYGRHFAERAELHLVTGRVPPGLPPGVQVHTGLTPNDQRLRDLYARCDLFVLPTRADFVPWACLEALATGRPVITTTVGGGPDVVREGETGFLVAPDDPTGLAARINQLLDDPDLRRRMGAAGRQVAETQFNAAVNVPRTFSLMKLAVDQARAAGR